MGHGNGKIIFTPFEFHSTLNVIQYQWPSGGRAYCIFSIEGLDLLRCRIRKIQKVYLLGPECIGMVREKTADSVFCRTKTYHFNTVKSRWFELEGVSSKIRISARQKLIINKKKLLKKYIYYRAKREKFEKIGKKLKKIDKTSLRIKNCSILMGFERFYHLSSSFSKKDKYKKNASAATLR